MEIDNPIRVLLEQDGDYAFRVSFAGMALPDLLTDEAAPLGQGKGPNPSRMLLASIANCLSASLLFALRKFHNTPVGLKADITALPVRNASGRWRMPTAQVELHLAGHAADYPHLERVLETFEDFCIVTQSVRDGIDVEVTVRDVDGRILKGDRSFEASA